MDSGPGCDRPPSCIIPPHSILVLSLFRALLSAFRTLVSGSSYLGPAPARTVASTLLAESSE